MGTLNFYSLELQKFASKMSFKSSRTCLQDPLLGHLHVTYDPTCVAVCLFQGVFPLLLFELCMNVFGGRGLGGRGFWELRDVFL